MNSEASLSSIRVAFPKLSTREAYSLARLLNRYPYATIHQNRTRFLWALLLMLLGFILIILTYFFYLGEYSLHFSFPISNTQPFIFSILTLVFLSWCLALLFLRGSITTIYQRLYCDVGALFFFLLFLILLILPGIGIFLGDVPHYNAGISLGVLFGLIYLIPFLYHWRKRLPGYLLPPLLIVIYVFIIVDMLLIFWILIQTNFVIFQGQILSHAVTNRFRLLEFMQEIQTTQIVLKSLGYAQTFLLFCLNLLMSGLLAIVLIVHTRIYRGYYRLRMFLRTKRIS